ncbi:MAG TPA: alpha/beta fold hydrolase [Terrimicrobiaceae bacterium]|nr:alpha/beta fold hydrolase [Terrimicrobiaceae bacterium]
MNTVLRNATEGGMGSSRNLTRRFAAWTLVLAIGAALTACASREPPVARRLGPAMCKEGPPAWRASDGRRIMYRTWGPAQNGARAVVVGVPGWNGTAGDIEPLALYLAKSGIRVYSTGVRGQHGDLTAASQRMKGHADDGRFWERDFTEFVAWVQQRHPNIPLFLYGQSMGSLTAILVTSNGDLPDGARPSGIILHSPAVAMMYASPLLRLCIAELRRVKPRGLLLSVGLIPGDKPALTNSAQFDRFWGRSVDRVRPGFTWSFFDETLKLGGRARKAVSQLDVPVIILTGEKDPIGTAGVGQRAFARLMRWIPAQAKERHRFADGYHDLIHDSNRQQALQCVGDWLDRQLRKPEA